MPAYDYDCAACGRRFEVVHGVYVEGPTTCPLCGKGPVRKAISAPAIHYKGSGWAKKERRATSTPGSSRSTAEETGSGDDAAAKTGSAKSEGSKSDPSSDSSSTAKPTSTKAAEAGAGPAKD
jgi:putative FmdB family regulatory protein